MKTFILILLLSFGNLAVQAQHLSESIKLNQVGYYPNSPKHAVVTEGEPDVFYVMTPDFSDTLYTGQLGPIREAPNSGERVRIADFSELDEPGTYIIWITKLGYSYQFTVSPKVYEEVAKGSLKGYYHQRASTGIPFEYGGQWARPAGHPDTLVVVHPSAASSERPAHSVISAPKGWYDAGDYNKYSVNSGISMGTLFSLYEDYPEYMSRFTVDIPESGNELPDILDENLWNLRWFLNMQDPNDGGVYHKLTTANFSGQVMPVEAKGTRYIVQKSITGTLNFAAVMAQASRILSEYEHVVPGLVDSTLEASKAAWQWALENPDQLYDQNAMNEQFNPDILTGAYGDSNASDEFIWAAAELYATTRDPQYLEAVEFFPLDETNVPNWGNVQTLAYYTLSRLGETLPDEAANHVEIANRLILDLADSLIEEVSESGYGTVMDRDAGNYHWGGSGHAGNQGVALINAYRLSGDRLYLDYALSNLDHLLGRNATGYSFLTGFGSKPPLNIHHRPSQARALREPVPGLLSGGPNPGQQDECTYPSDLPALSYIDDWCSYAANEITINWNAPVVYLSAAMEALQYRSGYSDE